MSKHIAALRAHREKGARILIALIEATPGTVTEAIERETAWAAALIPMVEVLGDHVAAKFEPLGGMKGREQEAVLSVVPLNADHRMALACHAVRMSRLDKLFDRLPVALPGATRGEYARDADKEFLRIIETHPPTFKRGELTVIANKIATELDCSQSTVIKAISDDYHKMESRPRR